MFRVETIDARNITWSTAFEIARARASALAEDLVQRTVYSNDERVDLEATPPITDFEALRAKVNIFESRVVRTARNIYAGYLGNSRYLSIILRNEDDVVVGVSQWVLPKYADPGFNIPLIQRLYSWWLQRWYKFLNIFLIGRSSEPVIKEYAEARALSGIDIDNSEHHSEELSKVSPEKLEKAVYPSWALSYYLDVFGIRSDYHAKGIGRKLFTESFKRIKEIAKKPPNFNGPAKIQWQAAPSARGFYHQMGGIEGPRVKTKKGLDHTVFYMNID